GCLATGRSVMPIVGWLRGMMIVLAGTLMGGTVAVADAPADPPAPADQESRIAQLERRVAELEALLKQALDGATAQEIAELKRRIDLLTQELEKARLGQAAKPRPLESRSGLAPAASKGYGTAHAVPIASY